MAGNRMRAEQIREQRDRLKARIDAINQAKQNAGIIANIIWSIRKIFDKRRLSLLESQLAIARMQDRRELIAESFLKDERKTIEESPNIRNVATMGHRDICKQVIEDAIKNLENFNDQMDGLNYNYKEDVRKILCDLLQHERGEYSLIDNIEFLLHPETRFLEYSQENKNSPVYKAESHATEKLLKTSAEKVLPELIKEISKDELSAMIQDPSKKDVVRVLAENYGNDIPYEKLSLDDRKTLIEICPEFAKQFKEEPSISEVLESADSRLAEIKPEPLNHEERKHNKEKSIEQEYSL